MGSLLKSVAIMMKLVFLACVAAMAAAEADADAYYGGFGYPYAYGYVPFGSSSGLDPITQGLDPVTQGYGYHAGYYGKRSADAGADPYAGYAYGAYPYAGYAYGAYPYAYGAYGVPFGYSSGQDPITQGLDAATQGYVPYYGYGHYA